MDMKNHGETCGNKRVYRVIKVAGIRSPQGYNRHREFKSGDLSHVTRIILDGVFDIDQPNQSWVTDFTYIRTHEDRLYLTILLVSTQIVGWNMKSSPKADLVIDTLLMALRRKNPEGRVLIHSG